MSKLKRFVPVLPLVVFAILLGSLAAFYNNAFPQLSAIDEQAHVDYLFKIADGHIPRANELMGQKAMHESNCRGFYSAYVPPPCGEIGSYDPANFVWGGVNAAGGGHPPFYYIFTAIPAKVIQFIPGVDRFFDAGRIASSLWLAVAFHLLWILMREQRTPFLARVGLLTLLASVPSILTTTVMINNDAAAFFSGAVVLFAVMRKEPSRWLLFGASLIAVAPKATNIVAVFAGMTVLMLNERYSDKSAHWLKQAWQRLFATWPMLLGGFMIPALWAIVTRLRALPVPDSATTMPSDALNVQLFLSQILVYSKPLFTSGTVPPFFSGQILDITFTIAVTGITGIGLAAAFILSPKSPAGRVAIASSIWMVIGGVVVLAMLYVASGVAIQLQPRYAMSLVPFMIYIFTYGRWPRPAQIAICVVAAIAMGSTLHGISGSEIEMVAGFRD